MEEFFALGGCRRFGGEAKGAIGKFFRTVVDVNSTRCGEVGNLRGVRRGDLTLPGASGETVAAVDNCRSFFFGVDGLERRFLTGDGSL